MTTVVPVEVIVSKIVLLRQEKVLLDRDLAELYGVETKQLKRAVRRNINRFPSDFMFELSKDEFDNLRSHFGTSSWGGTRYRPMAFTEQGVSMLSSVLNSDRAIEVNITIMRAFVKLRRTLASHKNLARKLSELETQLKDHDEQIQVIFEAIKQLIEPEEKSLKKIGFKVEERSATYGKRKRRTKA